MLSLKSHTVNTMLPLHKLSCFPPSAQQSSIPVSVHAQVAEAVDQGLRVSVSQQKPAGL